MIIVLLFSAQNSVLLNPEDKDTTTARSAGEYPPRRVEPSANHFRRLRPREQEIPIGNLNITPPEGAVLFFNLKVCHLRFGRSIIQSCSACISIYTYSHEQDNVTSCSNNKIQLHVSALYVGHHQVVQRTY